jgi:hypothetical protein
MSHFGVLVIGTNVAEQLAPFHQFECTGNNDQYVQEIEDTEEARKTYDRHTTTVYRDPDGSYHQRFTPEGEWDIRFWREPTDEEMRKYREQVGDGYTTDVEIDGLEYYNTRWDGEDGPTTTRVQQLPEGWTEVEVLNKVVMNFAEFIEEHYGRKVVPYGEQPDITDAHKYGYTLVDAEGNVIATYDRTNPNRKWDWYAIGGRYRGFFKLKDGCRGILSPAKDYSWSQEPPLPPGIRVDSCRKGDIDIDGMMDEAQEVAEKRYDLFTQVTEGCPKAISWKAVQQKHLTGKLDEDGEPEVDWGAAREEYNAQPMVIALRDHRDTVWFEMEDFDRSREEYIEFSRKRALVTFAILKDGVWHEKGEMGWWAAVSGDKGKDAWATEFWQIFDTIPDDAWLTLVDCHI